MKQEYFYLFISLSGVELQNNNNKKNRDSGNLFIPD